MRASKKKLKIEKRVVADGGRRKEEWILQERDARKQRAKERFERLKKKRAAITAAILLFLFCWCSEASARDALAQLNWRRERVGLPAYKSDPSLQRAAEASAQAQARSGRMFHNRHIGSRSGIGMGGQRDPEGRRFYTCYAFGRGTAWAGAAAVVGRNGRTFYSLDLRNSPSGSNGRCKRCGRVH